LTRKKTAGDRLADILDGGATRRKHFVEDVGQSNLPSVTSEEKPNILITGVSRYWGERLALLMKRDRCFGEVFGIDVKKPRIAYRRTEFTHLDIRSPLIIDFLISRKVRTVVHLQVHETENAEELFQRNVMDFMFLLSACADAGVENFLFMSETAVYGYQADNPVRLREHRYLVKKNSPFLDRAMGQAPALANLLEVEKFTFSFRKQNPNLRVVPLRFAPILGPRCNSWMTRYLREPVIPTVLGFDPLIQVVHEDDVPRATLAAACSDIDGPINLAAPGILTLHQMIRRMGGTSLPFARPIGNLWRRLRTAFTGEVLAPMGHDSLKYSCIGDLRRMKNELCYVPRFTGAQTLDNFSEHRRMARYYHESEPDAVYGKYVEGALKQILAEDSLGMGDL
jgi:UDP-glucose 4-epimerase